MKAINLKALVPLLFLIAGIGLIIWYFATGGGPYSGYTGRTTGTVTSCMQTGWATGEDDMETYDISVRYAVEEKEYSIPRLETHEPYSEGEEVELAFPPDDPSAAVLGSTAENGFLMPVVGGVLCLFAAVMFVAGRKKAG